MTLDVSIGLIKFGKLKKNDVADYESCNVMRALDIKRCPDSEADICDPERTLSAKEAYRSGSTSFWDFWDNCTYELYHSMRDYPNSNDTDIAFLKPVIDDINALPDPTDEGNADRMKWLKYWANKAVELYGDRAGIRFS